MLPNAQMQPVAAVINGFSDIFIKMVDVVMKGAPFFVFALLAGNLRKWLAMSPADWLKYLKRSGAYTGYTILGLLIMILLLYPAVIAFLINRKTNMGYMEKLGLLHARDSPCSVACFFHQFNGGNASGNHGLCS